MKTKLIIGIEHLFVNSNKVKLTKLYLKDTWMKHFNSILVDK